MKKSSLLTLTVAMLFGLFLLGYLLACNTDQQDKAKDQAKTAIEKAAETYTDFADSSPCECKSSWFPHSQTADPNGSTGSPFDSPTTTNCIFHQWSWQKFLYLTKPQPNGSPLFLNEMIKVDAYMKKVNPELSQDLVLEYTTQAGSNGILKTNANYNPGEGRQSVPIYYGLFVNRLMFDSASAFAQQLEAGTLPHTNTESFPVNSLELKTAWVNVSALPSNEANTYFTTTAAVQQADKSYEVQTMALVGMHVVGIVINHPEFIWATFEHTDMAPLFNWEIGNINAGNELVYGAGITQTLMGIQWDKSTTAPVDPNEAYTLYQNGVPRIPGNKFMVTSQKEPENFGHITEINKCVADNLKDVFKNYFYKGSIWINMDKKSHQQQVDLINELGENISDVSHNANARGCTALSNLTMETFDQTFAKTIEGINVHNTANCFSCHNAVSFTKGYPRSPLYLSHLFDAYYGQLVKKHAAGEIVQLKRSQYLQLRDLVAGK